MRALRLSCLSFPPGCRSMHSMDMENGHCAANLEGLLPKGVSVLTKPQRFTPKVWDFHVLAHNEGTISTSLVWEYQPTGPSPQPERSATSPRRHPRRVGSIIVQAGVDWASEDSKNRLDISCKIIFSYCWWYQEHVLQVLKEQLSRV